MSERKRAADPIESLEHWSVLEANQASKTADPGSVSLFSSYEAKTKASDQDFGAHQGPEYWLVHPSVYVKELTACFHSVRLLVPLLISPYFLGDRLEEGLRSAMSAATMRYNAKLHGKILTYDSVQIRGGAKHPVAECIPELRGHVAVPVEASCLVFAPTVGSIVFVDVSRVALKGTVIGHILAQATVRFDAEALFGKFMHVSANRWRYGEFTLQARDVVSARVVRVGQEDESGLLMTCEVEPADEMIVLSSDGKRTVLKPLSPAAITAAVAAASSAAAALNSAVKSGSRKSTGGSGKKVRLIE